MEPAILIDKSRDLLSGSATPLPPRLDSPISTTSSISTMPPNSPTPPTIPASTCSQVLPVTENIVLSKDSPVAEFLKFPKLPLELRRLVFRQAMPRPAVFTIQREDQFASDHDCLLPESDYTATNCSEMDEYWIPQDWWLVNFAILDSEISFDCDEGPTAAVIHRNPALRSVCKESLMEFDLQFPLSLVLTPGSDDTPHESHDPYRFYFNKHDVIYLQFLLPTSRMCGFPNMMALDSWTKHIEILHVPFECFQRGSVDYWGELARGLVGVMKAFPALKEVRTSNRDPWKTNSWEVEDWSAEYINDKEDEVKGTEDTDDDGDDTDEELDEESEEEEEDDDDDDEDDNGGEEIEAHKENSEQDDGSEDGEEEVAEEYKQEYGDSDVEEEVEIPEENSEQQNGSSDGEEEVEIPDENSEQQDGGGDSEEEFVEVWEDEEVAEDEEVTEDEEVVEDDNSDDDGDGEEESNEDASGETEGDREETFELFQPQLVEMMIEALEETDCVKKGEVNIPVIKVHIAENGMVWNSTRDIRPRKATTSD
ncbi:hypothetical protein ACEPPN_018692 [Leptodophora sp. 'Broadleaf-Isolate-01']